MCGDSNAQYRVATAPGARAFIPAAKAACWAQNKKGVKEHEMVQAIVGR